MAESVPGIQQMLGLGKSAAPSVNCAPARRLKPMKTHSSQNERIKRAYFTYLAEAKGFSQATLDWAEALNRLETCTKFRDFKAFHIEQAKGFKASLADQTSVRTKDRLSKTLVKRLAPDKKPAPEAVHMGAWARFGGQSATNVFMERPFAWSRPPG
jgi:hypothetical protein